MKYTKASSIKNSEKSQKTSMGYYMNITQDIKMTDSFPGESINMEDLLNEVANSTSPSLWVFGYGSLVWKPGFEFHSSMVGYITGYERRFYQGNTTHRGTTDKPGRVATLIPSTAGRCWGLAFKLQGKEQVTAAFEHLGLRECTLGGYDTRILPFIPKGRSPGDQSRIPVLLFTAIPENKQYIGDASVEYMTNQIVNCRGTAGHNVEYITKLADWQRTHVPEFDDPHMYNLDFSIREKLRQLEIPLHTLMSEYEPDSNSDWTHITLNPETLQPEQPNNKKHWPINNNNSDLQHMPNNIDLKEDSPANQLPSDCDINQVKPLPSLPREEKVQTTTKSEQSIMLVKKTSKDCLPGLTLQKANPKDIGQTLLSSPYPLSFKVKGKSLVRKSHFATMETSDSMSNFTDSWEGLNILNNNVDFHIFQEVQS